MNAPFDIKDAQQLLPLANILKLMAQAGADSWAVYPLELPDVVDPLQEFAERTGLVAQMGQDAVQAAIAEPFARCHQQEKIEGEDEGEYLSDAFARWEMADPRDRWRWTGEAPPLVPAAEPEPEKPRKPYETPEVTEHAFWFLVLQGDANRLAEWLRDRPRDVDHLQKLLKAKLCTADQR